MKRVNLLFIALVFLSINISAQISSGGNFTINKSVIASGGGMSSAGDFKITGTIGQSATQISDLSNFTVKSGFWTPPSFAPTAATASISRKVSTGKISTGKIGRGVANVIVHLTDQNGNIKTARTNQFGYFRFENIEVGQTLVLNAYSKQYQFNTQVINFDEDLAGLNITAQ